MLEERTGPVDAGFEAAADAIHAGDLQTLRALLDERPELIRTRSSYAHRATLLHYVAANGIEAARQQQSPPNAVQVARELLDRGAEPDATCETYGGGSAQTTLYGAGGCRPRRSRSPDFATPPSTCSSTR